MRSGRLTGSSESAREWASLSAALTDDGVEIVDAEVGVSYRFLQERNSEIGIGGMWDWLGGVSGGYAGMEGFV